MRKRLKKGFYSETSPLPTGLGLLSCNLMKYMVERLYFSRVQYTRAPDQPGRVYTVFSGFRFPRSFRDTA